MLIGSKLPFGLILELTDADGKTHTQEVKGLNSARIIGAEYVTTETDSAFGEAWFEANAKFPAVVNGTLFIARNDREAAAVGKDADKTGLEPLNPGDKSNGVQTADA